MFTQRKCMATYKSSDDILGGSARNSYSGGASLGISGSMIVT